MEFKNIEQLTITDCCNRLNLKKEDLQQVVLTVKSFSSIILHEEIFGNQELYGEKQEIAQRLVSLLIEDRECFQRCRTMQEYEDYLSKWEDGLWKSDAEGNIQRLTSEKEERSYYTSNKKTLNGLNKYLKKYPNRLYANQARNDIKALNKRKHKKILVIILLCSISLFAVGYFNYYPAKYLSVNKQELHFGKRGGTLHLTVSTAALDIDVYNDNDWLVIQQDGNEMEITTGSNTSDFRDAEIEVVAYSKIFGNIIGSERQKIRIIQDSGAATYIVVP